MDLIIELIFRGLIVNVLGLYSRFYFFKLIGKEKQIDYLLGEKNKNNNTESISQHAFNIIIGLIVFAIISFAIAYLVWGDW